MSRLELPIIGKTLRATGDTLLRAELKLLIRDRSDVWKPATFRVDPGTEMTTMAAAEAKALDLPLPRKPVRIPLITPGNQEVRAGLLRARVAGMDATEYVFPCYFLGDPDAALPTSSSHLLGLTGVINQIRLSFDGTPASGMPYGRLIVEKL